MAALKGKYAAEVLAYARGVADGSIIAGADRIAGCQRFLDMLDSGSYDIHTRAADFVIGVIECTFRHRQGEALDGTPMRGKPFLLEPWEKFCVYGMLCFYYPGSQERVVKEAFIFIPRKNSKAVSLDTLLPTPKGWKLMRDIQVGEQVFGQDGKPSKVLHVSEIFMKPMYAVEFDDGSVVKASGDHIWTVQTKDSRRALGYPLKGNDGRGTPNMKLREDMGWYELTTKDMLKDFCYVRPDGTGVEYRYRVPMCEPVQYPKQDLLIDPYVLGVWLGDGSSGSNQVTVGEEDAAETLSNIISCGYKAEIRAKKKRSSAIHIDPRKRGADAKSPDSFRNKLVRLGVFKNKHIPAPYLIADVGQRVALLQGLMDTDGTCSKAGQCTFIQKNKNIAVSVKEILSSLGVRSTLIERDVKCNGKPAGTAWFVQFFTDVEFQCFRIKRKSDRLKKKLSPRMLAKSIVSITSIPEEPSKCIMVDNPRHLYLVGKDYTATHNTFFIAALAWGLGLLERASGAKVYVVAVVLKQAMETFDNWEYNLANSWYGSLGEAKADGWRYLNNNMAHSIENENIDGGSVHLEALAGNAGAHDSFNCNVVIADEIHAYKSPEEYNRLKEATKAYTNKLVIGISTAGDNAAGFCAKHLEYCTGVVQGQIPDDALFAFICKADEDENGEVDYLSVEQHMKANPNYGVTIRPHDMERESIMAQNSPIMRKDFITRSLNVFVSSMKAYFNVAEFVTSNAEAGKVLGIPPTPAYLQGAKVLKEWREKALDTLLALDIEWYGGTDLSKLHDLTAAALYGQYKDIDIIITHEWFPIVAATAKADEDQIPLFGWQDEGHLTMTNAPTTNHADVIKWYVAMRNRGFRIRQIGHDRKFAREYFIGMKHARFVVVDQPQLYYKKNEGFRRIEVSAKNKRLYYLGSSAFEYCVGNVRAIERADDAVMYEKAADNLRIDVFDAAVFAAIRMLEDKEKATNARKWLDG